MEMQRKTDFPFAFRSFIRNFAVKIKLQMTTGTFFKKIFSPWLWLNLLAMAAVVLALCFGVRYGLDFYTHHGEKIRVPNVRNKSYADAEKILENSGLTVQISDTGYVKSLPPDCVLEQSIVPGSIVKSGRIVYVVINASNTPTLTIPDVIDNSSYREARAKLEAMGFKVGEPQYVNGEQDWVYGIKVKGRLVGNGQKVPIDALLVIQVGDGLRDMNDSVLYIDAPEDDFEELPDGFVIEEEEEPGVTTGIIDNSEPTATPPATSETKEPTTTAPAPTNEPLPEE